MILFRSKRFVTSSFKLDSEWILKLWLFIIRYLLVASHGKLIKWDQFSQFIANFSTIWKVLFVIMCGIVWKIIMVMMLLSVVSCQAHISHTSNIIKWTKWTERKRTNPITFQCVYNTHYMWMWWLFDAHFINNSITNGKWFHNQRQHKRIHLIGNTIFRIAILFCILPNASMHSVRHLNENVQYKR